MEHAPGFRWYKTDNNIWIWDNTEAGEMLGSDVLKIIIITFYYFYFFTVSRVRVKFDNQGIITLCKFMYTFKENYK